MAKKRLVFFRGPEPDFQRAINDYIMDEQVKVVDIVGLHWMKHERQYIIGVMVEEQERFFRQNCLVVDHKQPELIGLDLEDFSTVMESAKNVQYNISLVRIFVITPPSGKRFLGYVIYED